MNPVLVHLPKVPAIPLVLDSPHSGTVYPADFVTLCPPARLRQAEDTYVNELWAAAPTLGATLVEATFPRTYLDPNRAADDLNPEDFTGRWPMTLNPTDKSKQGIGLIWTAHDLVGALYSHRLGSRDAMSRIERYWRPYTDAVANAVEKQHAAFGGVWHLNCHSMPSERASNLADVVLGDRDGTTCAREFRNVVAAEFKKAGLQVIANKPYKGVELVRRHGQPASGRHSLQIELNRALYLNEATRERSRGFADLQAACTAVVTKLAAWIPTQLKLS